MAFKLKKTSDNLFHKVSESKLDGGKVTQQPQVNMEAPSSPAKSLGGIVLGTLAKAAYNKGKQMYSDYQSGKSAREKDQSVKPKVETKPNVKPNAGETKPKADPYSKAAKKDSKLGDYVAKRKTLKKGSAEWNANQNKINKAYGVKKRYAETAKPISTIKPASIQVSTAKPTANLETKKPVQAVESKPAKQTKSQKLRSKGEAVLNNDNFSTAKKQRKSKRIRKRYDKAVAKEQKQNNKKTNKSSAPDYSGGASGFM
jgi:hypothetical protein